MLINAQELHSSLVKVSSGLTGSGVWINMGHSDYSYVFTAKHNIKSDQTIVTDQNATELDIVKVIPLDGIDISIIKINGRCKVNVGLCLNKDEELSKDSTCWILGHPKSLVNNSEHQVIDHEGKIIVHSDKMFFQIDDILPEYRDRTLAEGFSGGPIFEIEKNQIYLKGIITDTFDDDFNYQRIKGIKLIDIHNNLPQEIVDEIWCQEYMVRLVKESCDFLGEHIKEYIVKNGFLKTLKSLDVDLLKNCNYFYLPDDKPRETQHLSLLRNNKAIQSYIYSRVLAKIMDTGLEEFNTNPTTCENEKVYTIHITNFTKEYELIPKLIMQSNSIDYDNSIILIIYSNDNNDLSYVQRGRIEKMIANYTEEPTLYDKDSDIDEMEGVINFLESHKKKRVRFSIININFLIDAIIPRLRNEMYRVKYQKELIEHKVLSQVQQYA
ncbi:TPA: trypsin-like peptidase domain-containing protein [Vibrio parahaemolyticus]|uniref:hypothetical protein n=1 Tax=Vibrio alginolyticus TaxID=663 RepID=UPI001BD535AB|nr:hypothetical protein [Vibrio alginolyticus]MBS9921946.1 trypsin-like peptidase domain-containing protein [Vibrio alginolyticus]MDG2659583.1 hypothetical protein [Vibrio parahaemolyticus]HCH5061468.1 trypsin-like peptidase domain-containing protein [Vibrio parahaemolyticus]